LAARKLRDMNKKPILLLICTLSLVLFVPINQARAQPSGRYFDNVVTILMENVNICNIVGTLLSGCGASNLAPYMTSLAKNWSFAIHYTGVRHPSMPNYLALLSGQTWGCTMDDNPNSSSCTASAWNSVNSNLVDRLPSSITWKAYMENMTSNCEMTDSGTYGVRHDPFVYFNDIVGNATRCGQVVPAGTGTSLDSTVLNDLNSANAPNFLWLTPNLCDDMHSICTGQNKQILVQDCASGNLTQLAQCVPQGDNYLKNIVPQILNSYTFTHTRSALFITYDEGTGYCPNGTSTDDCIYTLWAGPVAKISYESSAVYKPGHYSWLKTIEDNWGLSRLVTGNDCSASSMTEFFGPNFVLLGFNPSPLYVHRPPLGQTFNSGNSTLTILTGNIAGTATITYSPAFCGDTTSCPITYPVGPSSLALSSDSSGVYMFTAKICGGTVGGPWTYNFNVTLNGILHSTQLTVYATGPRGGVCPLSP
jgi:hypothetical protein